MSNDSPEVEHEMSQANSKSKTTGPASKTGEQSSTANGTGGGQVPPSAAAAATGAQPKVVQTAFIHKLYKYDPRCSLTCGFETDPVSQYVGGQEYSKSHLLDKLQRELCDVAFAGLFESFIVRGGVLATYQYLAD